MTTKNRIAQLEKTRTAKNGKIIVMRDAGADGLAEFDGVKMTQAEAEAKAAALGDEVLLLHVKRIPKRDCEHVTPA